MTAIRISERVSPGAFDRSAGASVDADSGTITGAVICGYESANRRKYPWKETKLAGRVGLYEGAKVNLNHSKNGRTFQEWVGVIQGAKPGDDGRPRGTVRLFKSDPYAAKVLEAAQVCPDKFGLSHVVRAKVRREGGVDVVEDIEAVESVDIVVDPATVAGLFEGIEGSAAVELTLGQLVESQEARVEGELRKELRRWLFEMEGNALLDAPVDAPPDAADHGAVVDGAITSVMTSAVSAYIAGEIDEAELGKRIKTAAKAHPKLKGEKKDDAPAEDKPDEGKSESVQLRADNDRLIREAADLRVKLLAAEKGVKLTEAQAKVLARCDTDAERAEVMESFAKPTAKAETPRASGRMSAAELLGRKVSEGASATSDAKAFARAIRN